MGLLHQCTAENKLPDLLQSEEIEIIGIAHNIPQATALFSKTKPHIVIMNIEWPAMPGMLEEMAVFIFDMNQHAKLIGISDNYAYGNMQRLRSVKATGYICWNKEEVKEPVSRVIKVFEGGWALNQDH